MIKNLLIEWDGSISRGIGSSVFILLLIISTIQNIKSEDYIRRYILGWSIFIIVIIFNPIVVHLLSIMFYSDARVMRLMWSIPYTLVVVVAIVDILVSEKKDIKYWIIVLLISILVIDISSVNIHNNNGNKGNLYVMQEDYLAVANIMREEIANETNIVWSDDCLELYTIRQIVPNIICLYIDTYFVAEEMTYESLYGEKYETFVILSTYEQGKENEFCEALGEYNISYYILKDNSVYNFILDYIPCELVGSAYGNNIYKRKEE